MKYTYCAYPTIVFGKPDGVSIPQIGHPQRGVGGGAHIELATTGYPTFDVSYGWAYQRPWATLGLSILTPPIISTHCILQEGPILSLVSDTSQGEYAMEWAPSDGVRIAPAE